MTDKQIIIDGCDVSGCSCHYNGWSQLYRDNRDMCDKGYDLECKPKENGCYHYTKCLEEQLDQLKFDYAELEKRHNDSFEQFKQLKEQFEAYKMEAEEGKEINAELKAENEHLSEKEQEAKHYLEEAEKFKNCLTEIKEIAEGEIDSKEFMAIQCMLNGSVDNKNKVLKQILQKISECEVEDD